MAFFSAHRASFVLAFFAFGCSNAPPPKHPVEETPVDLAPTSSTTSAGSSAVPRELVGATLQAPQSSFKTSHDPHPPASIPGRNISWFVPKKIQNIEDVTPTSTHFGFASNKLIAIAAFFSGESSCKSLRNSIESRYGAPTMKSDTNGYVAMNWQNDSTLLSYSGNFSDRHPEDDRCDLTLEDSPAERVAQENDPGPPMGHAVDHFGTAKLLASKTSFQGLTLKEKNDDGEWWVPATKTYRGIALSRFTYKFQHDKLVNVGFDVANYADCPKLLSMLKSEYGTADERSNGEDGSSYDWTSPGGKLTFTPSSIMKKCGGILYAVDPQNTTGSPFFKSGSSTPASSADPFETTSPTATHVVQ